MRKTPSRILLSPRDLIAELECDHRLHLDWSIIQGLIDQPPFSSTPELELLKSHGFAHEKALAQELQTKGSFIKILSPFDDDGSVESAFEETKNAMQSGIDYIYSPTLSDEDLMGYPDFLIKARDESGDALKDELGRFVYDPVDAKSAKMEKRAAVLQVATYAFILEKTGFPRPQNVHLWLAGDRVWSTKASDVIDLAEEFFGRARTRIASFKTLPNPKWAAPRESCSRCRWSEHCDVGRRDSRDLSLIQGIRSTTRLALIDVGITTIEEMASASDDLRTAGKTDISRETFENLRDQAKIQVAGSGKDIPIYELKDSAGLSLMPPPSQGDIWFDMEGDPYAEEGDGLEYMFGFVYRSSSMLEFKTFDAKNRDEERTAFKEFITFVSNRRSEFPDCHVYHYASYEPTALLRLAQRHGVFEYEVDRLIRNGVFVDLYSIVRKSFRFSTESLSIKKIEPVFYEGNRDKAVSTSIGSVVAFEDALEKLKAGEQAEFEVQLQEIRDYNEDDCRSTQRLDDWIRKEAIKNGIELKATQDSDQGSWVGEEEDFVEPISIRLLEDVPIDSADRTEEQSGKALVAASIEYHHREERPAWWALFDKALSDIAELQKTSDVVIPREVQTSGWYIEGRKNPRRNLTLIGEDGIDLRHILDFEHIPQALYEHAPFGFKNISSSTRGFKETSIVELESEYVIVQEKAKKSETWSELPIALLPGAPIPTHVIKKILREEIGQSLILAEEEGFTLFPQRAHFDVLLRRKPRQKSGSLPHLGNDVESITQAVKDCDNSYVAVQGPPGTGKTYVGVNVIVNLVREGWRIGVVAQSHAVIENLMNGVRKADPTIPIAKKAQSTHSRLEYHVEDVSSWTLVQARGYVIGGTTWSYASNSWRTLNLDLVVIDEAGQYSLANALVSLSCGARALLLGDPQQLPHVSQGKHPEPIDNSVLRHILGNEKTISDDWGYFLSKTYRLHPTLARPVSQLQYENRLTSDERCSKRKLNGIEPGLHVINLEHQGNTTKSLEEAEEVVHNIRALIGKDWIDTDNKGESKAPKPLGQTDILVITAYNNQVRLIKQLLAREGLSDIKVGTIDKFQGQEAAVVLISMATSSSEDLPRGIEFLLSPNRLNVAISRAKFACFLIRSSVLSVMEPNTADGMVMLGKFITLCKIHG